MRRSRDVTDLLGRWRAHGADSALSSPERATQYLVILVRFPSPFCPIAQPIYIYDGLPCDASRITGRKQDTLPMKYRLLGKSGTTRALSGPTNDEADASAQAVCPANQVPWFEMPRWWSPLASNQDPQNYTSSVTGSRAGGAMNSGPTGLLIVSRRILSTSA
jgi:hypothetical protein